MCASSFCDYLGAAFCRKLEGRGEQNASAFFFLCVYELVSCVFGILKSDRQIYQFLSISLFGNCEHSQLIKKLNCI